LVGAGELLRLVLRAARSAARRVDRADILFVSLHARGEDGARGGFA
jgi:hypothetical protein